MQNDKESLSWPSFLVIAFFLLIFVSMSGRNIAITACVICFVITCIFQKIRKNHSVLLLFFLTCIGTAFSPIDIAIRQGHYRTKIIPVVSTHGVYKHIEEREKLGEVINRDFVVYRFSGGLRFTLPKYAVVIYCPKL